ncbi:MAG: SDR family NAD(P)-dependent oxidoreductase [Polyangiaceae bacterium]|nr:SDR family NAD(P)-dependent oxidoreductase [Polyangiaceae bacterium]
MSPTSRWSGRVALVTGASSGIGAAVATELAELGMHVVLAARRPERLTELAARLGAGATAAPVDLRDAEAVARLFERIRADHGGVDVLVNSAGLGRETPLIGGSAAAWREMLELNVLALCVCTSEAVSDMRRRGDDGHVIHLGSMAGHRVPQGSGMYSATKYAVRSLTEGLRQELRELQSNIRVSCISPGYVATEFHQGYFGSVERAQAAYSQFPVLQPTDIAKSVRYVLEAPPHMQVHDLLLRPTRQPS